MEENIEIKLTNTSKSVTVLGAKPIKYVTTKTATKTAGEITINELRTDDLLVIENSVSETVHHHYRVDVPQGYSLRVEINMNRFDLVEHAQYFFKLACCNDTIILHQGKVYRPTEGLNLQELSKEEIKELIQRTIQTEDNETYRILNDLIMYIGSYANGETILFPSGSLKEKEMTAIKAVDMNLDSFEDERLRTELKTSLKSYQNKVNHIVKGKCIMPIEK